MNAPLPKNEHARLAALERYQILDTGSDEAFDRITRLAAALLKCPIACISFIDTDRQWFKSHHGMNVCETARDDAFCAHALLAKDVFVIPDATIDARFAENPFVTAAPNIRFYAGAQLITEEGLPLGTLCAIDHKPREMTDAEKRVLRDLAAMVMNEMNLRRLASVDALTKAYNRRYFTELAEREIARARRHGTPPLSLMILDADKFKVFNDSYGHQAGDLALAHLVERARLALRQEDFLGRMGGEEFAILLPHTDIEQAKVVAERVRSNIADAPIKIGVLDLPLTVSIGVAQFQPESEGWIALYKTADAALYRAKEGGRNRVVAA